MFSLLNVTDVQSLVAILYINTTHNSQLSFNELKYGAWDGKAMF
jgi:hypothetical protein